MSNHTYCDVVPFKIENVATDDGCGELCKINTPKSLHKMIEYFMEGDWNIAQNFNNWNTSVQHTKYGVQPLEEKCGSKNKLHGFVLQKGDKKVIFINEDEYECVGGISASFVANDKASLEEFCKDFGLECPILVNETAQRTY